MEYQQAVANIQQAVNPHYGEQPADALIRQLQQLQLQNLEAQQQSVADTKSQIKGMQGKKKKPDMIPWAMLADMFAPAENPTNFTGQAQALQQRDTSAQDLYRLQNQLARQQQGVAGTAGDLLAQMTPKEQKNYDYMFQLQNLRHKNKMEQIAA